MTYMFKVGNIEKLIVVKDITLNVRIRKDILSNITLYDDFDISDGDTPEKIADRVYKNPNYNWIVMLCNELYNYGDDFPLSDEQLAEYVNIKYGNGNGDKQHILFGKRHFETEDGKIVDAKSVDDPDKTIVIAISNLAYETSMNEKKRRIKLIHPKIVDKVVSEIERIFESSFNAK